MTDKGAAEHGDHLVVFRQVVDAEQRQFIDCGHGFLERLARGGLLDRLARLDVSARQRPEAERGLDGAAAQQHLALPFGDAAGDDPRIAEMGDAAA